MSLAAITFADPLMLAGLAAAGIPIVLHLLNTMRAPVVPFPTLRFLRITSQKTARRRHVQQYFLLLVRVIVFALIAAAVAAPLIRGGNPGLAYGFVGMLLAGVALLVLAVIISRAALDKGKAAPISPTARGLSQPLPGSAAPLWGLSVATIAAGLLLGGYSAYGLVSDRYFTTGGGGEFTGQATALVVLLDNSHSMLARDKPSNAPDGQGASSTRTRLEIAKTQVQQLLGQTLRPREAAILTTNPLDPPLSTGLTTDLTALNGYLEKIVAQGPQSAARPMQERLRTALETLRASSQPNKMLVIVSDFAKPAFSDVEVFGPLKKLGAGRKDLQVVLMPARASEDTADVGITGFGLAEGTQRPVVGAEVTFEAQLVNNGQAAEVRDVTFLVDGKVPEVRGSVQMALSPRVQLGGAGGGGARTTVHMTYRLAEAGPHRFGVQLANAPDALAWDDSRELLLDVAEQVKVLVVGAEAGDAQSRPRARSAAFYFQAALAPFGGADVPWSIKPTYRGIEEVQAGGAAALQGYAAVFMCDVPRVSPGLADALVAYAHGGGATPAGRVVWVLGPSVNQAAYNEVLLGNKRDLLPAPLGSPMVTTTAQAVDWVDLRSGIFMNLFDSQEPFRNALVTGRWTLNGAAQGAGGRALAKLADNTSLVVQHGLTGTAAGTGRIYTVLTTPAAVWSNLGSTVLLVPMASRMALGDYEDVHEMETSYATGQSVTLRQLVGGMVVAGSVDVMTPAGATINVKGVNGQWVFDRTEAPGAYGWKSIDGKVEGHFVVNVPGEEADLAEADVPGLAEESSPALTEVGEPTLIATSAVELLGQMQSKSEGTSLMPGFLAMVLMLAVVEALLANRGR